MQRGDYKVCVLYKLLCWLEKLYFSPSPLYEIIERQLERGKWKQKEQLYNIEQEPGSGQIWESVWSETNRNEITYSV